MDDYDCCPLLGGEIKSAFSQAYSNVDVAACNDGSTDNAQDVMSLFGERIVGVE